ncbi:MAG: ATP-binding protein [Thermoproteota archaeon]|jgi:predicted AAA+ superfamily ATPase
MLSEGRILEILVDWNYWGNYKKNFIRRDDYFKKINNLDGGNEVIVIKGVRRSGKSSIAYFFIKDLIDSGLDEKKTLFINFEDPRLPAVISLDEVNRIFETYLKNVDSNPKYVILDEVQYVEAWEKFARFLPEARDVKVIVTGSSSKLMSEEYSTVLTGRHVDIEVFPLSFDEFLKFKNFEIKEKIDMIKERIKIKGFLDEYIEWGGFPEVVLSEGSERKTELLKSYFYDILLKDIVKRYKIKKVVELERLAKFYISNISTIQSFHKLKNLLNLSLDTVERFSRYMYTARLFLFLDNFSYSLKEQIRSKKKVYTIDLGFYKLHGFKVSENIGRIIENVVMLHLMRRAEFNPIMKTFYLKINDYEVDFVIKEGPEVKQLIQVTYVSSRDELNKREIKSLVKASELLNCENLTVITWEYEDKIEAEGKVIKCLPLWKWLLEDYFRNVQF